MLSKGYHHPSSFGQLTRPSADVYPYDLQRQMRRRGQAPPTAHILAKQASPQNRLQVRIDKAAYCIILIII